MHLNVINKMYKPNISPFPWLSSNNEIIATLFVEQRPYFENFFSQSWLNPQSLNEIDRIRRFAVEGHPICALAHFYTPVT